MMLSRRSTRRKSSCNTTSNTTSYLTHQSYPFGSDTTSKFSLKSTQTLPKILVYALAAHAHDSQNVKSRKLFYNCKRLKAFIKLASIYNILNQAESFPYCGITPNMLGIPLCISQAWSSKHSESLEFLAYSKLNEYYFQEDNIASRIFGKNLVAFFEAFNNKEILQSLVGTPKFIDSLGSGFISIENILLCFKIIHDKGIILPSLSFILRNSCLIDRDKFCEGWNSYFLPGYKEMIQFLSSQPQEFDNLKIPFKLDGFKSWQMDELPSLCNMLSCYEDIFKTLAEKYRNDYSREPHQLRTILILKRTYKEFWKLVLCDLHWCFTYEEFVFLVELKGSTKELVD
jgi:hypothetical protein